jgi:hypothetical protein
MRIVTASVSYPIRNPPLPGLVAGATGLFAVDVGFRERTALRTKVVTAMAHAAMTRRPRCPVRPLRPPATNLPFARSRISHVHRLSSTSPFASSRFSPCDMCDMVVLLLARAILLGRVARASHWCSWVLAIIGSDTASSVSPRAGLNERASAYWLAWAVFHRLALKSAERLLTRISARSGISRHSEPHRNFRNCWELRRPSRQLFEKHLCLTPRFEQCACRL